MNKLFATILIFSLPIMSFGQDKITKNFYNDLWELCDSTSAIYVSYKTELDTNSGGIEKIYSKKNILISEIEYSDLKNKIKNGFNKQYYPEGELKSLAIYKDGQIQGDFKAFYKSGKIKRIDKYDNNNFTSGKCLTETGLDTAYYIYEEIPEYPGGAKGIRNFLSKNFQYPKQAAEKGISGKVIVGFIINKVGDIEDEHIIKSVHPLLDSESLRIIRLMDKWKPGKQNGEVVDVNYAIPINFSLK